MWEALNGLLKVDDTVLWIHLLDHGFMKVIAGIDFLFNGRQGFWCSYALPPYQAVRSRLIPASPSLEACLARGGFTSSRRDITRTQLMHLCCIII